MGRRLLRLRRRAAGSSTGTRMPGSRLAGPALTSQLIGPCHAVSEGLPPRADASQKVSQPAATLLLSLPLPPAAAGAGGCLLGTPLPLRLYLRVLSRQLMAAHCSTGRRQGGTTEDEKQEF